MKKCSNKKSSDYVSAEMQKRIDNIKKLMELEGYKYKKDFAHDIDMEPQNFSRCMKSGKISEYVCKKIIKAFPNYQLDWLLGYSDTMTAGEKFLNVLSESERETQLLHSGFFAFAQLAGFKIEVAPLEGQDATIIQNIKRYCTISQGDKSATLSIEELNNLENELCDYVKIRLQYMLK